MAGGTEGYHEETEWRYPPSGLGLNCGLPNRNTKYYNLTAASICVSVLWSYNITVKDWRTSWSLPAVMDRCLLSRGWVGTVAEAVWTFWEVKPAGTCGESTENISVVRQVASYCTDWTVRPDADVLYANLDMWNTCTWGLFNDNEKCNSYITENTAYWLQKFAVNDVYENNGCFSRALCKAGNCTGGSEQHFLIWEEMEHKSGLYCKWVIRAGSRHDEARGS